MGFLLILLALGITSYSIRKFIKDLRDPRTCSIKPGGNSDVRRQIIEWISASTFLALGLYLVTDVRWWALPLFLLGSLASSIFAVNFITGLIVKKDRS